MSRNEIFDKIKEIVVDQLDVDAENILETSSFLDDLNADSLDMVELVMAMEEEFDISITDEAAEKISTISDAIEYIVNALQ